MKRSKLNYKRVSKIKKKPYRGHKAMIEDYILKNFDVSLNGSSLSFRAVI